MVSAAQINQHQVQQLDQQQLSENFKQALPSLSDLSEPRIIAPMKGLQR